MNSVITRSPRLTSPHARRRTSAMNRDSVVERGPAPVTIPDEPPCVDLGAFEVGPSRLGAGAGLQDSPNSRRGERVERLARRRRLCAACLMQQAPSLALASVRFWDRG